MRHLGAILQNAFQRYPDEVAAIDCQQRFSFEQIMRSTIAMAMRLDGLPVQSKVAIWLGNHRWFSISYFAILFAQHQVVPLNPLLSPAEVARVLKDCDAKLLIAEHHLATAISEMDSSFCPVVHLATKLSNDTYKAPSGNTGFETPILLESKTGDEWKAENRQSNVDIGFEEYRSHLQANLSNADSEETAVVLYTSGTTGHSKGVELTHRNLIHNAMSVAEEKFSTDSAVTHLGEGDVALAALPLSHVFGQTNVQNGVWLKGGAISYLPRFSGEEAVASIQRDNVTFFPAVPTMYFELVKTLKGIDPSKPVSTKQTSSLKYCVCGGAPMSARLKQECRELLGVPIQESYGLTETSPMISCQKPDHAEKSGTVGKPIRGVEIQIRSDQGCEVNNGEVGEIYVRGANVFRGYFNQPELTAESFVDGWFRTGDLAYLDDDGELVIVARKQEVINRGGYKIIPSEVERIISQLDFVEEVVVIGVPDERLGQEVNAFVTLMKNDAKQKSQADLVEQIGLECEQALAKYKRPRKIQVLKEFPKGPTGKISRKDLKQKPKAQVSHDNSI